MSYSEFLCYKDGKTICLQCRRCGFNPWVGKILWRKKYLSTLVFLPGEFHGQRSPVGYSPWGCKVSDTTERLILSLTLSLSFFIWLKIFIMKTFFFFNVTEVDHGMVVLNNLSLASALKLPAGHFLWIPSPQIQIDLITLLLGLLESSVQWWKSHGNQR